MLTEVHTGPSQNDGCFHDYLTSEIYFIRDSNLIKFHPDFG